MATIPAQANLRTARIIAAALAFGVITFWLIIWFLTGGGVRGGVAMTFPRAEWFPQESPR